MIISHSQDFLNGICTNTIHLDKKRLKSYGVSMKFTFVKKTYAEHNILLLILKCLG